MNALESHHSELFQTWIQHFLEVHVQLKLNSSLDWIFISALQRWHYCALQIIAGMKQTGMAIKGAF